MLKAENLGFGYRSGHWLLRRFNLTLDRGEWLGIQGPSGSGKTTLGQLLSGYLKPQEGRVTLFGRDVTTTEKGQPSPVQQLFQHPELAMNPCWRARRIISEGAEASGELLTLFDIQPDWLNRYPHQLSGGQLARLALVRAMAVQPDFIIADEITASLDAINQAELWHRLLQYAEQYEIGVCVISHNRALLKQLCKSFISL